MDALQRSDRSEDEGPASALPSHASVVVIGGGVMGCSTLYHLAAMGAGDAILLERNQIASGTTWHSAAQVRALRHSRNLTRMIRYSIDLYSRLESETGQSTGWIGKGSLSIATTPDRLVHIRRQEALAHAFGVEAVSISPDEAKEHWPAMNVDDVLGAVWSPGDGRVGPSDVSAALAKAARTHGARLFETVHVTGILTGNGQVRGVETDAGVVMCEAVAVCAGRWSCEVAAMGGARAPLLACEHFYLLTGPVEGIDGNMPTLSDHDGRLYIRDDSGGLLIGCFEPTGKPILPGTLGENFAFGLLPEDWDHFEPMMMNALHRLPVLETAEARMLLNGPESFTPDGMFMLGETAETQGLFLGCGMNSVGVASAGGAGMNLAHCILRGHTAYDLSEADAMRFAPVFDSVEHLMARAPEVLGAHYEIAYSDRQWGTARNLRRMALDAEHRAAGAHMGQFYGWERPLYFGKIVEPALSFARPDWFERVKDEVVAAHERAAVFDLTAFGKIEVEGPGAEAFLEHMCASNMARMPGTAIYTAVLNERGTYESDLTALRLAADRYRLYTGAAAIQRDLTWFRRHAGGFEVVLRDATEDYAVLALMGPDSGGIAAVLGASELNMLGYFRHASAQIAGCRVRATRLSYVGEAGWELTCQAADAAAIHGALLEAGAVPAGLHAQTSMRIEKGYAAMGHELDGDIGPVEVGLDRFCSRRKRYIGSNALAERRKTGQRSLATILLDNPEALPLGHEPVLFGGRIAGQTTSAAFGYRIGRPLALAHVSGVPDGAAVEINIARTRHAARLRFAPAFDPAGRRMCTGRG
ncbi:MAG: FAD-dependent oxidoreductase [Alphaproteobacteria bacterium]|nr:FAD-dependent oxidoreductase [Alphaproteobacteria bacterium]